MGNTELVFHAPEEKVVDGRRIWVFAFTYKGVRYNRNFVQHRGSDPKQFYRQFRLSVAMTIANIDAEADADNDNNN